MPVATSFAALKQMIRKEVQSAMQEVNAKALINMQKETANFYSIGKPHIYIRTGALKNSPKVDSVFMGGDYMSFWFYLSLPDYYVPNPAFTMRGYASYFSTLQVMNAAEYHFAHVLGRPGFWHRAYVKTEHDFKRAFSSRFH